MADTAFSTSHASTITRWSALLFKQAQKQKYFQKFVGDDENSMIQTKTNLLKEPGDTIKFDLLMNLTGSGVTGDTEIEGNEEQLVLHQDSVTIDLRGNGVKAAGKMSAQRTAHSIKKMGKTALGNWLSQAQDDDFVLGLSGQVNTVGQTTAIAPDSDHKWMGGETVAGVVESVATDLLVDSATLNLFGCNMISWVKRKAKLISVKVRPLFVEGGQHYVMFLHPYQVKALTGNTIWKNAQYYAATRGKTNPIFSGALGMIDNVILHEYEKCITRLGAGGTDASEAFEDPSVANNVFANGIYAARALFCGAQAGVIGYGQYPGWYEKNFDYGRVPGVATDVIYGMKKTRFNSKDFGVIAVDTAYVGD